MKKSICFICNLPITFQCFLREHAIELLDKYTTFMAERLIPMKELSIKRMNQFLAEHRSKLSSSEIEAFDKMVQKLNMAGQ